MTIEELQAVVHELTLLVFDLEAENEALRALLVDKKVVSEEEIELRLEDSKREGKLELQIETKRRAYAAVFSKLESGPIN